jgi:hypothetical protein
MLLILVLSSEGSGSRMGPLQQGEEPAGAQRYVRNSSQFLGPHSVVAVPLPLARLGCAATGQAQYLCQIKLLYIKVLSSKLCPLFSSSITVLLFASSISIYHEKSHPYCQGWLLWYLGCEVLGEWRKAYPGRAMVGVHSIGPEAGVVQAR